MPILEGCEAIVKEYKPVILVLLETRMLDHKTITETLCNDSFLQLAMKGLSSGI